MALITWEAKYETTIKQVDSQHKQLVEMINRLHEAMQNGKGKDVLNDIMYGLEEYVKLHFATEENLMKNHGYLEFSAHKKEHDLLTKQVADIYDKFRKGSVMISLEVLNFLKDWLINHILKTDMKYVKVIAGK